jgi:aryl sulfotransferase
LLFRPNNDDVFVTTYPKCGTTWMSFICHCLRTRGDTSFGEITEVVPWTIVALDCGQDLNAQQMASPRLFKAHDDLLLPYLPSITCNLVP